MKMKIEPVKIDPQDPKIFASIAFILDQDELLRGIYKIRERWQLTDKLVPYGDFDEWYKANWGSLPLTEDAYYYLSNAQDQLEIQEGQGRIDFNEVYQRTRELAYLNVNDFELDHLLKKDGVINPLLKNLILKAIVCGEVKTQDWKAVEEAKNGSFSGDWLLDNPKFYKRLEKIYKTDEKKRERSKHKITRDREWYYMWLNLRDQNIGIYETICDEWNKQLPEKDHIFDINLIEQAISRYRKFLQADI